MSHAVPGSLESSSRDSAMPIWARGQENGSLWARTAVVLASIALGCRLAWVAWKYSVNIFFWDQWSYLTPLFRQEGLLRLFLWQHGIHREGIGLLINRLVFHWTRWSERSDSYVIVAATMAAMCLALLLKRKLFGPIQFWDIAIPAMFLTVGQYETVVGNLNLAPSTGPLLMIMAYCLALLWRNAAPLRYGTLLLLNFLLIYTGYGLLMGLITIALFVVEAWQSARQQTSVSLLWPVISLALASATLGSFFLDYSWTATVNALGPERPRIWAYPWFAGLMFSRLLGRSNNVALMTVAGTVVLVAALVILLTDLRRLPGIPHPAPLVRVVLLGYSLLYCAATAIGRISLGLPMAAEASRYVTLMIPAYLGLYFFLLEKAASAKKRKAMLAAFVIVLVMVSVVKKTSGIERFADRKRAWAECYRRLEDIAACDQQTHFQIYPWPEETGLRQKLEYLKKHRLNLFIE